MIKLQPSQYILIAAILFFVLYVFRIRTLLTDRIIYLTLVAGGIVLVVFPYLSTVVANIIGVGRGTDLLLYILVIFSLFYHANNASRMRKIERQLTALIRKMTIAEAIDCGETIDTIVPMMVQKNTTEENQTRQ